MSSAEKEYISTQRHRLSNIGVYDVTEDELEQIESAAGSIGLDFQIALASLSVAMSILATIIFSSPTPPSTSRTVFIAIVVLGFGAALISGIRWSHSRGEFAKLLAKIRSRQVGPLGDEGHQVAASDLAQAPLQSAPSVSASVEAASAADAEQKTGTGEQS